MKPAITTIGPTDGQEPALDQPRADRRVRLHGPDGACTDVRPGQAAVILPVRKHFVLVAA